jgi:hypothetical protein
MTALLFLVALVWGSLSAQFFVQATTSLILSLICFSGLVFSRVSKALNAAGTFVSLIQALVFAGLFLGGNWIASNYIDYETWNVNCIAGLVAFLGTIVYCAAQVPGKVLLTRMTAWGPYFMEAANTVLARERVAFARKYLTRLCLRPTRCMRKTAR